MARHDGKTTRRRIKKLRIDETSVVDQAAQRPARIAIMKRAADTTAVDSIQKNRLAMTTMTAGHSHTIVLVSAHAEGMAELKAGTTSFAGGSVHDWIMDDAGNILISDSDGHSHGLAALVKAADDVTNEELLAESVLASLGQNETPASVTKAAESGAESNNMTPEEKAAFEKAAEDQLNVEKARGDRAESIVKLSPDQRAHYDALPEGEQGEFLTSETKDEIVKNSQAADKVIYKSRDGDEFKESDDPRLVKAAQRADKAEERTEKIEKAAKQTDLVKRANTVLKNSKGSEDAKAALLGAVEGIEDAELRKSALEIVTAKDAGLAKAFATIGTADAGDGEDVDVDAKITKMASELRKLQPKLTPEQAYVAVLETPEGLALHAQL